MNATELTFKSAPRISRMQFAKVLVLIQSPAAPFAIALYGICVAYGIDPAVALAFFKHESSGGTAGLCKTENLKNWGNVRSLANAAFGRVKPIDGRGSFAQYDSWLDGLADWCERILVRYVQQRGLATVAQATPIYAPSSDGNAPERYAASVAADVTAWMAQDGKA